MNLMAMLRGQFQIPEIRSGSVVTIPRLTKGEPVMAKAELLPKDILVDLEQGDRTELFLGVAEEDSQPETIEQVFARANQLGQAFANSSGSSFLSAQAMTEMQNWQMRNNMQNQPSAITMQQMLGAQQQQLNALGVATNTVGGFIRGR